MVTTFRTRVDVARDGLAVLGSETMMRWKNLIGAAAILIVSGTQTKFLLAQISRYDQLSATPFKNGYVEKKNTQPLLNELFQRAVQTYLWAQAALNM